MSKLINFGSVFYVLSLEETKEGNFRASIYKNGNLVERSEEYKEKIEGIIELERYERKLAYMGGI